jgi:peptidoglycan/xylan/chitin deacetylase (PgdA/CDA1 family)
MKPIASVSLDLDNEWTYLKVHGDATWESYPSYLDIVVPRVLRFFEERNLTITFFVVGQDAALEKNHTALASLSAAGHEIGNHSFAHEPWLHLYSEGEVEAELGRTEDLLEEVTGQRPIGFRGPGFSVSETVLKVLKRRGYQYDASTFPTFLGPLARAYYFMTAHLSEEEKKKRKLLFGAFAEGLRPLKPYRWRLDGDSLIEIPVTTLPILKIPFHISYIQYLAAFSPDLARLYFKTALRCCLWTGVQPSLLLHPLDFLGSDDVQSLSFFPAMKVPSAIKMKRIAGYIDAMGRIFDIRTMREHGESIGRQSGIPMRQPNFEHQADR